LVSLNSRLESDKEEEEGQRWGTEEVVAEDEAMSDVS